MLWCEKKLVYEQPGNADGDRRIGYVEDGTEEFEVLSTDKGYPKRPIGLKQREIEHINYLALQEGGIAALGREEGGNVVVAFVEDKAVETAVDDVAQGSGQDKCKADYE